MKEFFVIAIVCILILYSAFSFVILSFDITTWSEESRFCFVGISISIIIGILMFNYLEGKK